jgi:hypothetical protein
MTTLAIKERPVLFSGPMVRAIMDGVKTQTRRIIDWKVREPGLNLGFSGLEPGYYCSDLPSSGWVLRSRGGPSGCWNDRTHPLHCPYGLTGDRLWVREAWRTGAALDKLNATEIAERCLDAGWEKPWAPIQYEADGKRRMWSEDDFGGPGRPRLARFIPRWASRLTLEVVSVRVERLREISEKDARAEGIREVTKDGNVRKYCIYDQGDTSSTPWADMPRTAVEAFRALWDGINAESGNGWDVNPWVWVIEFRWVSA